jgi:(S)-mandelate dehydrogenase
VRLTPHQASTREGRVKGRDTSGADAWHRLASRYAQIADLERRAKRRVPKFVWDFIAGGVSDELCLEANRRALDSTCIVPRYGIDVRSVSTSVTLFGREYAAPIGCAPMGLTDLAWPRADMVLAETMQAAGLPYVLSTASCASIEQAARIAPDVFWFQLYNVLGERDATSLDLIRRAECAGAHVLVVTLDVPVRARRVRDIHNRMTVPFRLTPRLICDVACSPAWAWATLWKGPPRFGNYDPYVPPKSSRAQIANFVHHNFGGPTPWELVERFRAAWPRAFVIKGILHPDDAARAVALGADGIVVSNHGGRQLEAAPATIDALPSILDSVRGRAQVLMDGGIRSGLDVVRALALGADAVLSGRPFLHGLMALGSVGVQHVIGLLDAELRATLAQIGARDVADSQRATVTRRDSCHWRLDTTRSLAPVAER